MTEFIPAKALVQRAPHFVMAGLVRAIHAVPNLGSRSPETVSRKAAERVPRPVVQARHHCGVGTAWMAGTRPAMTMTYVRRLCAFARLNGDPMTLLLLSVALDATAFRARVMAAGQNIGRGG